jgi:hypothetical protein
MAALIRVYEARRSPLVLDEIYAITLAREGLPGIFRTLPHDIDQPLHFVIVWAWRAIGGEGEMWMKALPILLGVATVLAVGLFARELFGRRAGLAAAALLAIQPVHVTYSQMLQHQALEWLLMVLASWFLWRWTRAFRPADAAAWVVATVALLLTDYYAYLLFWPMVAFGVMTLRHDRHRLLQWLGLVVVSLLVFSPHLAVAWRQSAANILEGLPAAPRPATDLVDVVRKLSFSASWMVPVVVALSVIAIVERRSREGAAYLAYLVVLPLALTWELTWSGVHVYILRNQFFAVPFVCALVAAGALRLPWQRARPWAVAALLLVDARGWALKGPLSEAVQLEQAAQYLRQHARPGDLVACSETHALFFLRYHLGGWVDSRLLLVPGTVPFHFSDGTLVMTPRWFISAQDFVGQVDRGREWWGVRMAHAVRSGPQAAELMTRETGGDTISFGRVTLWRGHPLAGGPSPEAMPAARPARPAIAKPAAATSGRRADHRHLPHA